jgi:hypothetical protein
VARWPGGGVSAGSAVPGAFAGTAEDERHGRGDNEHAGDGRFGATPGEGDAQGEDQGQDADGGGEQAQAGHCHTRLAGAKPLLVSAKPVLAGVKPVRAGARRGPRQPRMVISQRELVSIPAG